MQAARRDAMLAAMAWPEVLPPMEDERINCGVAGWELALLVAFFTGLGFFLALCLLEWWL